MEPSMSDTPPIKCARCNVPLEIWTETDEAQSGRCPSCGVTADMNTINTELAAFLEEHRRAKASGRRLDPRQHRFLVDVD
jgi:hypothetical protein